MKQRIGAVLLFSRRRTERKIAHFAGFPEENFSTLFLLGIYPSAFHSRMVASLGKSTVKTPKHGKAQQSIIMLSMPTISATFPSAIEPTAPKPNAKPYIKPDTKPVLPGKRSNIYISDTEKPDKIASPDNARRM
jgi:hypothetical protein